MRVRDVPQKSMRRFSKRQLLLAGERVAISHEWKIDNIQNVLAQARKLSYEVWSASSCE